MLGSNRSFHEGGFDGDPERIDRWHDILYEYLALADPVESIKQFEEHGKQSPAEFGETRSHTYQWLHSLRELGQFDSGIRADHPTAVVFNRDGKKNYVIYNAHDNPRTVTFSDGTTHVARQGLHKFVSAQED